MAEGISITEEYSAQLDEFVRLVETCPSDAFAKRAISSRRSFTEITSQLADAELLTAVRIRRIITQDHPQLYSYDQEEWARLLSYQQQKLHDVATLFSALRDANLALLRQLAYEDWNRTGHDEERGETSLFQLIENRIAQTTVCLDQLRAAVAEFTSHTNGQGGYVIEAAKEAEPETVTSGVKFYALALVAGLTIITVGFFTQSRPIYFFGGIVLGFGVLLILLTLLKKK